MAVTGRTTGAGAHPFFGPVPEPVLADIAAAGRMLIERCIPRADPWHARALADFELLAGDVPRIAVINPAAVDRARRALAKRLAQAPAAAMLAQRVADANRRRGDAISGTISDPASVSSDWQH